MTFQERYEKEETWYGRVIIMEIFHLAMTQRQENWTISNTAKEFNTSIGLVSENLRLAEAMHRDDALINCDSRQLALKRLLVRRA